MKRIVIDARMIGPIGHGIARYVQHIAEGLAAHARTAPLPYEPIFVTQPSMRIGEFGCVSSEVPFLALSEQRELPRLLKKLEADLYHSPSFASLLRCPCPWIVTVHDLIHLEYGGPRERLYYHTLLRGFVRRARWVMTVSEYSRARIADWAGLVPSSIEVVYNAIEPPAPFDPSRDREILDRHGLHPGRYILSLSNTKPHKNLPTLLKAYEWHRREVGAKAWPLVLTANVPTPPPGVVCIGGVSDQEVSSLLRGAGALFVPSKDEGFGRPPIEAAVAGIPVALSRIAPFREALAGLAEGEKSALEQCVWVDPTDVAGWAAALQRASASRLEAVQPGFRAKLLERYSISRLGEHMDRIYRRVLGLT